MGCRSVFLPENIMLRSFSFSGPESKSANLFRNCSDSEPKADKWEQLAKMVDSKPRAKWDLTEALTPPPVDKGTLHVIVIPGGSKCAEKNYPGSRKWDWAIVPHASCDGYYKKWVSESKIEKCQGNNPATRFWTMLWIPPPGVPFQKRWIHPLGADLPISPSGINYGM